MKKKVIEIDQEKCVGCGQCATICPMGVIKMKDGKAHSVNELMCDGAGKCIGKCPVDAIKFIEKEIAKSPMSSGCPGAMARDFRKDDSVAQASTGPVPSELRQWPVQLSLVNPMAPYFNDADIVIAADCAAFSFGAFHQRFLKGKTLIIFCPKLDSDLDLYKVKLKNIFKENNVKSITAIRMEVPCCSGIVGIIEEALRESGKSILMKEYTISIRGEIV